MEKRVAEEEDASSQLVGRIVEKGFDNENKRKLPLAPSLPRPSVLPFPVARHRSHGPHWAPLNRSRQMDVNDGNDQQDKDKDDTDFNPISSFANPIKRKQKKSLDLGRWRELVSPDGSTIVTKQSDVGGDVTIQGNRLEGDATDNTENMHIEVKQLKRELEFSATGNQTNGRKPKHIDDSMGNSTEIQSGKDAIDDVVEMLAEVKEVNREPDFSTIGYQTNGTDNTSMHDSNIKHEGTKLHDFNIRNSEDQQRSMSLESQIDAENCAHLQGMSADEIADAQREITEKMKPGLIEALKKRGRNKLASKSKTVTLDAEKGRQLSNQYNENQIKQNPNSDPPLEEPKTVHVSVLKPSNHTHDVPNTGGVKTSDTTNKWNTWSGRVESVRTLRFSLDGTILENPSFQMHDHGNTADCSQSSIDKVTERDFLRTEGDPGSVGYTIKEAVALSRSMVPGQRSLALQLLASVLDKALREIQEGQVGWDGKNADNIAKFIDWKAVWAYILGPDPELALSLRMALDDNHISVVFTTVKVLNSILSCDNNECFFDFSEKMAIYEKVMCTAPIFRSRPGIEVGFLQGSFWKYNTKPSNILPLGDETEDSENEGDHTIQDDVVVAGQDFAAGLIRMGIIPRIQYFLATDPSVALEEHLISILIGLARHSPTCANAIIKFPPLVQTIVDRFIKKDTLEINASKIKSMTLLKVLVQSDKKTCISFIEKGIIRDMLWHFYRQPVSFEQWIKSGMEYCKLMSALMVEQLRLWKVCIQYGYCISYFADFFPILSLWLTPPTFNNLIENNILGEFASITREAYLVLEALARRLPNLHSVEQLNVKASDSGYNKELWSWSHVSPMVESALNWISLKRNPYLSKIIDCHERTAFVAQESSVSSIVWVISAVVHMLSSILKKVAPGSGNNLDGSGDRVPWLPEFVPKIGLEVVKNRFLAFSGTDIMVLSGGGSLAKGLCHLRLHRDYELSLSSVCCLHGIVQLIVSLDKSIQSAKQESYTPSSGEHSFSGEGKILEDGIFMWSQGELRSVLVTFMTLLFSDFHEMQCIETFGRGGPAPGVGLGWGASGGGFWSMSVLLEQTESLLLVELFDMFQVVFERDEPTVEDVTFTLQRVNSVLGVCLIVGPRDTILMEKALDFLLQAPVLKYLDFCVRRFLPKRGIKAFGWEYKGNDYLYISEILKIHFRNRWLCIKRKSKSVDSHPDSDHKTLKKGGNALGTIYEDSDTLDATFCDPHCTSMVIEWAHQRLPLPTHWFLSPISTINDSKVALDKVLEVAQGGLFFLLGLEAMSSFPCTSAKSSPVQAVPLIWKLHSLSVVLLSGMSVLQEEKSRDLYRALQNLYGQLLNESRCSRNMKALADKNANVLPETVMEHGVEFLMFQSEVHESYTTFIDTFVEQFGAASYGDVIYGRQVSLYLHHAVEAPVRLATWNALSNAHSLELLPPLGECFAEAEGYLDIEDNEGILEAYAKSWVSGGLDKAALRGSTTFTLALHHLSSLFFYNDADDKLLLRNKLAKSLLRDYSRKLKHEGMILDLIRYNKPGKSQECEWRENPAMQKTVIERRLGLLADACEGNSMLLAVIEKLKSSSSILFEG